MVFAWMNRRANGKQNARSSRRTLSLEALENRNLLSVTLPGYAVPTYLAASTASGVTAMATSAPTGLSPAQIIKAYGYDKITFSNGTVVGDGTGMTIAIVDAYSDPNIASDLKKFDAQYGLSDPTLKIVNQSGGTSLPSASKDWAGEIALDVEWAHAVAPKASILLVEAASSSMSDLMTAVNYARNAVGVVVVSMSWGGDEFSGEKSYDSYFTTPSGHGGVTFVASSGDSGAPVSYPSVSPNVLSVGGTTLNVSGTGVYSSETGWSGSGGGISSYEAQPSYQKGVVTQSTTYRTNPDVSYDANPSTGFSVYDSYGNSSSTPWVQYGGTSAGAPQWAALIAIVDQGRALAGKSSLDGATQTLPMLYSLSSGDFHDITSGTSTGSPRYTASAGYDLVTGRGSPIANLVVADLAGQSTTNTTTHFSVTASTGSMTAGTTLSITVTALDASNNTLTGYLGTVQLTSSDVGAVLPSNYTFTASDKGVHTFTVKLVTAGSDTVTVADTATSSIVGTASVTVNPAAATHLAFGQQPASTTVGTVLSPAVTVKLLDAYNNVATNDNTDIVTIALGANTSGGILSGTTSIAVVGGVAVFGSLSIGQVGSGYTLVAKSGTLTSATSSSFNILAKSSQTGTVIEGFEGSSTYYVVGGLPTVSVSAAAKHDGNYGLVDSPGNDWIYRNDSTTQVKQGDTVSVWMQFSGSATGRAYFGFGAGSQGTLSLVAAANTGQLILQNNSGYGYADIAAVNQSWQANHWYRLEVSWGTNGVIIGKVYDSNGTTLLQSVTGSSTAFTAGGIAFRSTNSSNTYWDTVQVTSGVNQSLALKSSTSSDTHSTAITNRVADTNSTPTNKTPGRSAASQRNPLSRQVVDSLFRVDWF
jgi:subtilase family serine protease